MDLWLRHKAQIHYPPHDVRTAFDRRSFELSEQQLVHLLAGGGSIQADCSEAVTELCKWAGLADPNGLGYRYAGYTGTLLRHLPRYADAERAFVGALVVFGPYPGEHVSMVYERGSDPVLWSHGREAGPDTWPLSVERSWHTPPVTFLSIAHL